MNTEGMNVICLDMKVIIIVGNAMNIHMAVMGGMEITIMVVEVGMTMVMVTATTGVEEVGDKFVS